MLSFPQGNLTAQVCLLVSETSSSVFATVMCTRRVSLGSTNGSRRNDVQVPLDMKVVLHTNGVRS